MDSYSGWPIPPYIQQCRQQQPFGGLYPYTGQDQQMFASGLYGSSAQSQQAMNYWAGIHPGYGSTRPEDLRQIEEWKCGHCGSRFNDKVEKCKNCGSNAILRFDDPGEGARQRLQQPFDAEMATLFGPIGMTSATPGSHIKLTEEAVEYLYPKCWLSSLWSRLLNYLDGCGYRKRG